MRGFISLCLLPLLVACGGERDVAIEIAGLVGDRAAACGSTYTGLGTTGTDLTLHDMRLYVHDVRVVTADGREIPLLLEQDGAWQLDDIALLDFETGPDDGCPQGTAETNTSIRGTIPDDGAVLTGVRFTLGVPEERNHLDVSTAPSPLGFQSMYWGWNGGYKFLRVDAESTGQADGFRIHLGSTGCEGDGRGSVTGCTQTNRSEIRIDGFDADREALAVDLATLVSESDLDQNMGGPPGCMAGFDDMDCAPIFHGLGLPFDGTAPSGPQRLFRVVAAE